MCLASHNKRPVSDLCVRTFSIVILKWSFLSVSVTGQIAVQYMFELPIGHCERVVLRKFYPLWLVYTFQTAFAVWFSLVKIKLTVYKCTRGLVEATSILIYFAPLEGDSFISLFNLLSRILHTVLANVYNSAYWRSNIMLRVLCCIKLLNP